MFGALYTHKGNGKIRQATKTKREL